ncbi:MAG: hypothetical protein ACXAC7_17335 [Candidatus Hodarchaeales archaeon]|jgi:hypothetical protein
MNKNKIIKRVELFCGESDYTCMIPIEMIKFLLNTNLIYCCTITSKGMPHITPVMFHYEMNHCILTFLIGRKSIKAKNLKLNPFLSFTTDITHLTDPFLNTGIMVNTIAQLSESQRVITECLERLRRKYSSHLVPELVETYSTQFDICVRAKILKIVYWKGPYFKRFVCKGRKNLLYLKPVPSVQSVSSIQ